MSRSRSPPVDLAPMPNASDLDEASAIVDPIEKPVIPAAQAPHACELAGERLAGMRILLQDSEGRNHHALQLLGQPPNRFHGLGAEYDLVAITHRGRGR